MLKNLLAIIRYFIFWMVFFFAERVIFLLIFRNKLQRISFAEILKSFWHGIRIDMSALGYASILPLLAFLAIMNIPGLRPSNRIFRIYIKALIVICALITVINFNIYREWGTKVNYRAFEFLFSTPGEAIASSASSPIFLSLFVLAILIIPGFYLSGRIMKFHIVKNVPIALKVVMTPLLLGLNFLAIRGGWQLAPANESMAYYSSVPVLNHAAVNTEWALMRSFKNISNNKNPFEYTKIEEARRTVSNLYPKEEPNTIKILSSNQPNLVFIILESFTADLVAGLGGEKNTAPVIDELGRKGIYFNNIYSSGDRTDRGIVSVLSGFPTQATRSIIKENSKNAQLPSVYETLLNYGYHTSFYYGGESEFANIKSYLLNNGCLDLVDKTNFDKKDMNSKWGAYDDVVYDRLLDKELSSKSPFCSVILTLTNHEPFELPVQPRFKGDEVENKFRSTAFYTDSCLGSFIDKARKRSWYKNTLFVIVADHGHRLPLNKYEIYDPRRYRIPLLFFGEVIKPEFRGMKANKVGSQTDIASTIFNQLNIPHSNFHWSKDLLNPAVPGHAFFSWDNGFGFVNSSQQVLSFDNVGKEIIYRSQDLPSKEEEDLLKNGKAYMQSVYQQYLDY
ncbi:LTA synthase family protein [Desertivirga xinjiangensis]|uniref:LTA synthase family protein n=1 Tax=Desertivirga xinjiangensis TaxID=539206 RepID=UPI0021097649|nr:alkaline phosphatase family protein [Pedobacter xinjiangensis]